MAQAKKKTQDYAVKKVFMYLSFIAAVVLLLVASLALWAHDFTSNMVRTELSAQKIYFPEKGTPALNPEDYPTLQQYAGQLVDSPAKAEAYANDYIGKHLEAVADGKVYSEVSTEANKNPDNKELQMQKQVLFQGETLRGILLTSGYGFGTIGNIAGIAAIALFAISGALLFIGYVLRSILKA